MKGVLIEGAVLAADLLPPGGNVMTSPRIAGGGVTVRHGDASPVLAEANARGRFRAAFPADWLDEECTILAEGPDQAGLEFACVDLIDPGTRGTVRVLITLPRMLRDQPVRGDAATGTGDAKEWAARSAALRARLSELAHRPGSERDEWKASDLRGRWTLISFVSRACGPCRGDERRLAESSRELARAGIQVLHVRVGEPGPDTRADIAYDQALAFPDLVMTWDELRSWGAQGAPSNVLIDPSGEPVAAEFHGPKMIDAILAMVGGGRPGRRPLSR